jgi:hypothetical protein
MADENPSIDGLCIAICTLEAPPVLPIILRAVSSSTRAEVQTEILLVHGREVQSRVDTMIQATQLETSVHRQVVGSHGFSIDRKSALEWASSHRSGWSVLFLDDDDIPGRDLIRLLWDAHLAKPGDIVAGTVLGEGRPQRQSMDAVGTRLVRFHGASTMLIPGKLVRDCTSWLPLWLNHCGGEDTALCAEAAKRGVRLWEVSGAVAHEVESSVTSSVQYQALRDLHEAWVFSSLCRAGVIDGLRASSQGRLASAAWNFLLALVACAAGKQRSARRYLARGVGAICGLSLTPPSRRWLYTAYAPLRGDE